MKISTTVSQILEAKGNQVYGIHPESPVSEAIAIMNDKRIGALLVLFENDPIGIFSERDLLTRVAGCGRDPAAVRIREVMTTPLVVIRSTLSIEDAKRVVTQKRCRHLPVVDEGELKGLISIGDLMRWAVRERDDYIENLLGYINNTYPS